MKFFPGDWSTDPALTLCAPATRGVWIDLICAMHEFDQSGKLRGTADQLARFARCTTVEFVQAMTDLQTSMAADVAERNGVYEICNRRMAAAYKIRKSVADRVQRHRNKNRNGVCNAGETPQRLDVRDQKTKNPPPPNFSADSKSSEWQEVEEILLGFGVAKAADAVRAVQAAGCNPMQVRNLIEFWRGKQPAWGAGALYERLLIFKPEQNLGSLWPAESPVAKQQLAKAAQTEKQRAANEERRKAEEQRAADKREAARLEQQFGTTLDALERRDVKKLIGEMYPDDPKLIIGRLPASGPPTGPMRVELLTEIERRWKEESA